MVWYYIVKCFGTPLQNIESRGSNNLFGHRCIRSNTQTCRLNFYIHLWKSYILKSWNNWEQQQPMPKVSGSRIHQLSADSTFWLQTSTGLQISLRTVHRELDEISFPWPSNCIQALHNQSIRCSGVKHAATGLYSSGNVFSEVMNHASLSASHMYESGLNSCQENSTFLSALCQVWCLVEEGVYGVGLFIRV